MRCRGIRHMSINHHLQCISLLRDCKTLSHLKQIHAHASKTGLDADPLIAGKLLLLAATTLADALDYSRRLFSHIPSPDPFMYNTLIRGLSESDHPHHSLLTYNQMRRDSVPPDSFSFAFVLKAAANCKSPNVGWQLHSHVIHHGFESHLFVGTTLVSMYAERGCLASARKAFDDIPQPNVVAWNAIVTACFRVDDVEGAERLFERMPWKNSTSWNVMLAGYTKAGELGSARSLFLSMPNKDAVSWSTMITGFASNGLFGDAFGFFRELLREGCRPNEVSLTGVLSACAQAGALESGKILHAHIEKAGLGSIISVGNALLDMYARCGGILMASRVFDWEMEKKSIVSWTSMIAALAMHGYGEEAIQLFHKMEEHRMRPDGITFISVLYACSHSGLMEQGHKFFQEMESTYGIERSIEHYGCMVDLYGRAGLLDKAYEFITNMPMKPNAIIWRTLLGACSIHGNVRLAEHVREKLSELDPSDSGDYVLLSNIYAVAGKWKDVASVRRSMSEQRIQKTPGWSSIEVDKVVYTFVASDDISDVKEEAHKKLTEVMLRLKMEGYVPEIMSVLHDVEEEEKEDAILRHSEKLAVAFGLARMHGESVIRIVKNLRICPDCHTVMKLISKVYKREIVVRDRSRFHSFSEGSCSCRDYWEQLKS
ncbi:pentatricopeptide repeat-containing protein At1g74630 [Elaeis guineensis]